VAWRVASVPIAAAVFAGALTSAPTIAAPPETTLAPVLQQTLQGDLVMAANSNLLSAGGWRADGQEIADVDGDTSVVCLGRTFVPAACADNSSTARLDVPAGARIVAARLYVDTTLPSSVRPLRVRLDGPEEGFAYTELTAAPDSTVPKLSESVGTSARGATPLRQAVWDVTEFVRTGGPGAYTVADIVFERAGAFLPYASWAIVAAYELDPAADVAAMSPEQQARFAPRSVSWYDGLVVTSDATTEVPVSGFEVPVDQPVFGKTFHIVAHAQHRGADNLLFAGQPLGNNVSPGDPPPPLGVAVGADPACNTTTRVLDDSICVLGWAVSSKAPGATSYLAASDGRTPSSGSGVDMDVTRIPARYFVPGATTATVALRTFGYTPVATGLLAASIDLPSPSGTTP